MILIDISQLIHSNIYPLKERMIEEGLDETFDFFKHRVITQILSVAKKFSDEREIVLCCDGKNNWRYKYHPHYKGRRKMRRKDDSFPWGEFFEHMQKFEDEIEEIFPFNILKIDGAEGDDVIGALVHYIHKTKPAENIIIVSNDKDFKQLHIAPNIIQYDHKERKEIRGINPSNELMWLILGGDGNDDVMNVKTTDIDTFINPDKKQITMWRSTKVWEHIHNNTVMDKLLVDVKDSKTKKVKVTREQLLKNFERNKKLVDLTEIPNDIQKDIIYTYEENRERTLEKGKMPLLSYFIKNKMVVLSEKINEFDRFYKFNEKKKGALDEFLE